VTLPKGETHTVKVKDTPVPRDTPPGGDPEPPHTSNQKFTVWPKAVDGQTITSIAGDGPADSPQVFIAKKAEILQYLLDNSEGLMAQDKDWPENPADEPMNKKARLASVEIEKVWSDQLAGVEVNFFQKSGTPKNGTGRADKPYILMGARDDGQAYVKARLRSDIPSFLANSLLWRLAVKNGVPKPGSFTFDHFKKEISITADSLTDEGDYQIVVGYDANKDGQLSESEINVRSEWTFKVVSRSRFNSAVTSIRNASNQALGSTPNAARLLKSFADHTTPQDATAAPTTIARSDEAGLTHNVGVLFTPLANLGNSIEANFSGDSFAAITTAQTVSMNNWLSDAFESKRQEVLQTFQSLDPSILTYTFDWDFTGTLNFASYPNSSKDLDMFLALGKVKFVIRVEVPVHRSGYIDTETGVRLYGTISDLYDFDYDEGVWVIKDAARVQSGYNKAGDGGRVYRTKINFNDTLCPVTFNFY
jgi:hypothetical protein